MIDRFCAPPLYTRIRSGKPFPRQEREEYMKIIENKKRVIN